MTKYSVAIKRIEGGSNSGFRYSITVWWDKSNDRGDIDWAYTLWGAKLNSRAKASQTSCADILSISINYRKAIKL